MSRFIRGRKSVSPSPSRSDTDPNTCREVFQNHWKQACTVILCQDKKATINGQATADGVEFVLHHLEQMITLLVSEDDDGGVPGPILHYVLESDLLEIFCNWCTVNVPCHDRLRFQQLRLFEHVISQSHQMLLIHKPVIKPLLKLLMEVAESQEISNGELEFKLVLVLHQICICISQQGLILESFFSSDTDHGPARFLIFSLLIPFTYREGPVGQKARDALLLIMTLSARHPHIGKYIANHSHFCPVLATGLSGLYSSLPRRLTPPSEDWYAITKEDCIRIPDLQMFINSLQFSNAVVQVAHPLVRDQLIEFIYTGFLLPVLAPALHQDIPGLPIPLLDTDLFRISREEVMTATAYLDLFVRHVTDPHLLKAVLKFVLTEKYDDTLILDSLISRLSSNTFLSTVTLSLFHTLIELNCEDIMFQLVFRYLVPCTHVMVSQRRSVRDLDLYGKSAEKFLSLRPSCCTKGLTSSTTPSTSSPPHVSMNTSTQLQRLARSATNNIVGTPGLTVSSSSSSLNSMDGSKDNVQGETSYLEYLHEARTRVEHVGKACQNWIHPYDGENPAPDSIATMKETGKLSSTEDKEEVKTGFIEVGSIAARSESEEKADNTTSNKSTLDSYLNSTIDKDDVFVPTGERRNIDPKLYASLNDLSSFIEYLSTDESSDEVLLSVDTMANSLASLDDVIASVMREDIHRSSSAVEGSNMESSVVDVSSLSPIPMNSTPLSFIRQSDEVQGGAHLGKNTASTHLASKSLADKTSFEEISISELPKELPVNVKKQQLRNDTSSFINISVVPSDAATTPSRPTALAVGALQTSSVPSNKQDVKMLKDFKRGFSQGINPLYASSILSPTSSHGDSISQYRMKSPMVEELPALTPTSPKKNLKYTSDPPNIGPFLAALFSRLEGMIGNSLYFNLLLTGILSQLAAYPQPLLRSFLLNHNLVFQPSVKSLIQVLSSLRQKLDSLSLTIKSFGDLIMKARDNLVNRENQLYQCVEQGSFSNSSSSPSVQQSPKQRAETIQVIPNSTKERKKLTISDLFRRSVKEKMNKGAKEIPQLQRVAVAGSSGYLYVNKESGGPRNSNKNLNPMAGIGNSYNNSSTWNAIYCALVLDEFLKELAALSQEHSVLSLDEGYLSS